MNYENLYQTLQPQEKSVKDSLASLQKLFKAASRETESGDIKSLTRDIGSMAEAALALSSALEDIKDNENLFCKRGVRSTDAGSLPGKRRGCAR